MCEAPRREEEEKYKCEEGSEGGYCLTGAEEEEAGGTQEGAGRKGWRAKSNNNGNGIKGEL